MTLSVVGDFMLTVNHSLPGMFEFCKIMSADVVLEKGKRHLARKDFLL